MYVRGCPVQKGTGDEWSQTTLYSSFIKLVIDSRKANYLSTPKEKNQRKIVISLIPSCFGSWCAHPYNQSVGRWTFAAESSIGPDEGRLCLPVSIARLRELMRTLGKILPQIGIFRYEVHFQLNAECELAICSEILIPPIRPDWAVVNHTRPSLLAKYSHWRDLQSGG